MDLVIGGAFQGKTQWAIHQFGLTEGDIFVCGETGNPDFSHRCITHLENYALACLHLGEPPEAAIFAWQNQWATAVLICDDISCGVVPLSAQERAWREGCGRMLSALAQQADTVTRIFCGLPQRLK